MGTNSPRVASPDMPSAGLEYEEKLKMLKIQVATHELAAALKMVNGSLPSEPLRFLGALSRVYRANRDRFYGVSSSNKVIFKESEVQSEQDVTFADSFSLISFASRSHSSTLRAVTS